MADSRSNRGMTDSDVRQRVDWPGMGGRHTTLSRRSSCVLWRGRLVQAQRPTEDALEYSIAAGDDRGAARLIDGLCDPTYNQARITALRRWLRWLDDWGGMEGHPDSRHIRLDRRRGVGRPAVPTAQGIARPSR